jgi:uncharacterized protein YjiS (DUF1127 family)
MTAPVSKHDLMPALPDAFSPARTGDALPGSTGGRRMLRRALDAVRAMWARARVMNELRELTDHELADIGLTRGTIHRVFDRDFAADCGRRG